MLLPKAMNHPMRPRLPRERLTEAVRAIAGELARQETQTARCRDFLGSHYDASFKVVALWAFGSWARGAPTCGDVDLIVDHVRVGDRAPSASDVISAVRRRRRHVDLHVGTPEKLKEVAADAVLIWSLEHPDFEAAIAAIPVDPGAGRHARPLDVIPLDPRRLAMGFEDRDEIPVAVADGRLTVRWRGVDAIPVMDPELAEWADRAAKGKDARRVLPLVVAELRRWGGNTEIRAGWGPWRSGRVFEGMGVMLSIERWRHGHEELDRVGCRALVVVPHWTARGPNGVLVVTRGPNHPLVAAFDEVEAWTVGTGVVRAGVVGWGREVRVLEVFTRRVAAEEHAAWLEEDFPGRVEAVERVTGLQLLDAIDRADVVRIDMGADIAVSWEGESHLEAVDPWAGIGEPVDVQLLARLGRQAPSNVAEVEASHPE